MPQPRRGLGGQPGRPVYTLHIRGGVTFHDGTPMTVEDVVFSLDRIRNPELGSYVGWMLASVATVGRPTTRRW